MMSACGKRVACHMRSSSNRKHTTLRQHMPSAHRRYADWTPERLTRKAGEIGPNTDALVEVILRERRHPEQGFRSCIGILRLARSHGAERLEAACGRALEIGTRSYSSVKLERFKLVMCWMIEHFCLLSGSILGRGYFGA